MLILAAALTAATFRSQAQVDGPGTALLLNGTHGYATVSSAGVFNFTNAFTVEAWIKVAAFTNNWEAIVTKGDSAWRLHRYNNTSVISFGTSDLSQEDTYGVTPVDDGLWHHVAGVYDGTNKYLYIDGGLDAFSTVFGTIETNSYPLDIGQNAQQTNRVWDGQIDEVRIWNVARSQADILFDMHRNLTGNESGLVGYYRLDEGAGTNIANSAAGGSAENGTLVGDAAWIASTAPIGLPEITSAGVTLVSGNAASFNGAFSFNFQDTAYYFQYGPTTNYGFTTSPSTLYSADFDSGNAPIDVNQTFGDLSGGTTYHWQLVTSNSAGVSVSADQIFTTPAGGTVAGLHTFGMGTDGQEPAGGLLLSGHRLYGTTGFGGVSGDGEIFAINTDGTGYTNLYSFSALSVLYSGTNSDGAFPESALIGSGNTLYGTAFRGGANGSGALFAIQTDGTGFTNLYSFSAPSNSPPYGNNDGDRPAGPLLLLGNTLYGTANDGGTSDEGTLFSIKTDGSGFAVLHNFQGSSGDGAYPYGALLLAGHTLYGTTASGGVNGSGTVFAMNTDGSGYGLLYSFTSGVDGAEPTGSLVLSGSTLYGASDNGGTNDYGTVFALNTNGSGFQVLYTFTDGADGAFPEGGLLLLNNRLYGTAEAGGAFDDGTLFSVNTNGTMFDSVYAFTDGADGAFPTGNLVLSGNTLYGVADGGGFEDYGTLFALTLGLPPAPIPLSIQHGINSVILSWNNPAFTLQSAPAATGPYTTIPGAVSPYTNATTASAQFFRLKAN